MKQCNLIFRILITKNNHVLISESLYHLAICMEKTYTLIEKQAEERQACADLIDEASKIKYYRSVFLETIQKRLLHTSILLRTSSNISHFLTHQYLTTIIYEKNEKAEAREKAKWITVPFTCPRYIFPSTFFPYFWLTSASVCVDVRTKLM